ncbi:hypothetical protein BV902_20990 [Sphingobacterium sp. B29]|uniref:hypothetical protein n=1 Tax=Sphingobacterium sp. B29 TaxID=1933220 RepID=UPI00095883BA|nr:hypothetical protein [Sphingobacterium sp. B29]APU98506.1 hypothetical protein BV902_20990 [Sphingobacterium sp. B29]
MKTRLCQVIFYGGLLSLLVSCKIYENKKYQKQQETDTHRQYTEQLRRLYSDHQDTLSRLWYFWTDGAFRFYPDSGLSARSGGLLLHESAKRVSKEVLELAEKKQQEKQKQVSHEKSGSQMRSAQQVWIMGFVLLLFLLWRWGRSHLLP